MKKIVLALIAVLFLGGIAFAEVTVYNAGTQLGRAENFNCSTGTTCTISGQGATLTVTGASNTPTITGGTANGMTLGLTTPAAAKVTALTATGVVTDAAIYGGAAGVGLVQFVCISADGKFFGKSTSCN